MAQEHLIYGLHVVDRLLSIKPEQILTVYVANDREDARVSAVIAKIDQEGIALERVSKKQLDQWLNGENHQGIAAKIRPSVTLSDNDLMDILDRLELKDKKNENNKDSNKNSKYSQKPFLLILDGVLDPHNLGACMRTALAASVTAIIIPKDRSVSLTPTVRKVASGAADVIPLIEVTNLVRTMNILKERGIWIAGASLKASHVLYETDLKGPIAMVLGAEQTGLRRLTEENCDFLVKIPIENTIESLNVSVAAGICLFEVVRQRSFS